MSTTVESIYGKTITLTDRWDGGGDILFGLGEPTTSRIIGRAEFLAAVAMECDVTILDLSGYGVAEMPDGTIKAGKALAEPNLTAGDLDDIGRCYLALARYRRENPPVDKAQVTALAGVVDNLGREWSQLTETELARRLYLAGVRVETGATS